MGRTGGSPALISIALDIVPGLRDTRRRNRIIREDRPEDAARLLAEVDEQSSYALAGWLYMLRQKTRASGCCESAVMAVGLWLQIDAALAILPVSPCGWRNSELAVRRS
jgi:hypothetical protein